MPSRATDLLCTNCGLCCDGSLLGDVELAGAGEADRLECLGIAVEDDGDGYVLPQPCAALEGTRCSVYPHRPGSCRTFECALLLRVRRGDVGLPVALVRVRETRTRIARIEALLGGRRARRDPLSLTERCEEALSAARDARTRARLRDAMGALERSIRGTFLAERRPRASDGPLPDAGEET